MTAGSAFALTVDLSAAALIGKILFDREMQLTVGFISFLTGIMALTLLAVFRSQALIFTVMAVVPLIYSFSIGSIKNIWLIMAVIFRFDVSGVGFIFAGPANSF